MIRKVSIILPTFNEKDNIGALIDGLSDSVKVAELEIIVVDDDSPDMTWKIAQDMHRANVKVKRRQGERGLATAIACGLDISSGDVVGWLDADMCHPPAVMSEMLGLIGQYDIVIGSRYVPGGADKRGRLRVMTSRIINWFAGLMLGFEIKDYDSGFIVMKKDVFGKVDFPADGYGDYFIELMAKSKKAGFKIKEVPFVFFDRAKGESKSAGTIFDFCRLGFGYVWRIIKIRFKVQSM
ncbi:MAG TPA: glycosyltransferase [Candidatus Omnitrophota bacterium]|nr:glycosyltransferase [Candidatus Omnitrophota bacterium]HPS19499.1 glycosyltransferase [Candidatus Omnitrophota bacterium]